MNALHLKLYWLLIVEKKIAIKGIIQIKAAPITGSFSQSISDILNMTHLSINSASYLCEGLVQLDVYTIYIQSLAINYRKIHKVWIAKT